MIIFTLVNWLSQKVGSIARRYPWKMWEDFQISRVALIFNYPFTMTEKIAMVPV